MTAEEFLHEKGITAEKLKNQILFDLMIGAMEAYASIKQVETIDSITENVKKQFKVDKPKSSIILPNSI